MTPQELKEVYLKYSDKDIIITLTNNSPMKREYNINKIAGRIGRTINNGNNWGVKEIIVEMTDSKVAIECWDIAKITLEYF